LNFNFLECVNIMVESIELKKKRAQIILSKLEKKYGFVPRLFLTHHTKPQMLAAIILSAQSTDAQINKITEKLFKKYKTVNDFASADVKVLEKEIYSSGYYKAKAKRLISCFKMVRDEYGGKIPETISQLIALPGVGRKTANLVLASEGKIEGIAVDTHVARLSYRFGLTKHKDPKKIESDLMFLYPKQKWIKINGLFITHGRKICSAKKPLCSKCLFNKNNLCPRIDLTKK
jgi:endonuclease III